MRKATNWHLEMNLATNQNIQINKTFFSFFEFYVYTFFNTKQRLHHNIYNIV